MRDFLIVVMTGRHFAWAVQPGEDVTDVGEDFFQTVECGGNVWDTEDGFIPDDEFDSSYEVVAQVDVTGWSEESVNAMYCFVKRSSLTGMVQNVLGS